MVNLGFVGGLFLGVLFTAMFMLAFMGSCHGI
jgi:hypothetical protein